MVCIAIDFFPHFSVKPFLQALKYPLVVFCMQPAGLHKIYLPEVATNYKKITHHRQQIKGSPQIKLGLFCLGFEDVLLGATRKTIQTISSRKLES